MITLLTAAFFALRPNDRLWPGSSATFRARFKVLGRALHLPVDPQADYGPRLELASRRGGGATDLFLATEDWGLIQTRGRWQSVRTMQIYIQELASTIFSCAADAGQAARPALRPARACRGGAGAQVGRDRCCGRSDRRFQPVLCQQLNMRAEELGGLAERGHRVRAGVGEHNTHNEPSWSKCSN